MSQIEDPGGLATRSSDATPADPGSAPTAEARDHHGNLSEQLNEARWRYHVLDAPTISDAEFDSMMRELNELETQ